MRTNLSVHLREDTANNALCILVGTHISIYKGEDALQSLLNTRCILQPITKEDA